MESHQRTNILIFLLTRSWWLLYVVKRLPMRSMLIFQEMRSGASWKRLINLVLSLASGRSSVQSLILVYQSMMHRLHILMKVSEPGSASSLKKNCCNLYNLRSKLCWDIRSGSLDKFKEAFDKALNGEEAFSVAAHNCSESFMALFDEGCADTVITRANWDTSKVRDQLKCDIETHIASVCAAKLSELTALYEAKLEDAL
ncbi:hypothetical protein CerSpe_100790 [Prunus speciosa]